MATNNSSVSTVCISSHLSSQLNAIRGFAAIYIVAHHYFKEIFSDVSPYKDLHIGSLFCLGQEVVIVFIMLSGFLTYTLAKEKMSIVHYLRKRWIRIYPLYAIALMISLLVACYIESSYTPINWRTIFGNMIFMQDNSMKPGLWFECVGGNHPLWYLSYQWWDYVIFILFFSMCKNTPQRTITIFFLCFLAMLTYIAIPNHLSIVIWYYWIFELGGHLGRVYREHKSVDWRIMAATILMLVVWVAFQGFPSGVSIGLHPPLYLYLDFLQDFHLVSICCIYLLCIFLLIYSAMQWWQNVLRLL